MKKFLSWIILFGVIFSQNIVFATPTTSLNEFEINIDSTPAGGGGGGDSGGGLSGGAITGIVLGSLAGAGVLGGLVYYFKKRGANLKCGCVTGEAAPLEPICLDDCKLLKKLQLNECKYKYLIKAIARSEIKPCKTCRYIVLPDTKIENETFQSFNINFPEFGNIKNMNIKLTQVSDPFLMNENLPELDTRLMDNQSMEYPMMVSEIDAKNGILVKSGQLTVSKNKTAALVTSYDSLSKNASDKIYALLLEFDSK